MPIAWNMRQRILILNLHGIGTPKREVPPSEQRVWIRESQLHPILSSANARNDVELTFDDANESDYTIALPALQAHGMKAQFFLVAGRIGQPGFLSYSQIEGMLASGMRIGSHGMHHRRWADLDESELKEELVEAKDRLEQFTCRRVDEVSCPFGSYNRRVVDTLRRSGYKCIYTSDCGWARTGSLIQPRNSVDQTCGPQEIEKMLSNEMNLARSVWRRLKLTFKRWR
jgi:peptidoglycan/xylan/chitin deacetylase (PgdA/CDA1 family)